MEETVLVLYVGTYEFNEICHIGVLKQGGQHDPSIV